MFVIGRVISGPSRTGFLQRKTGRAECVVGEIGEETSDDKSRRLLERTYAFTLSESSAFDRSYPSPRLVLTLHSKFIILRNNLDHNFPFYATFYKYFT